MRRFVVMSSLALLPALALGACSGGSKTSGPEREVIAKAETICQDTQDKVGRTLADDPAADRDAIREATDKLMDIATKDPNRELRKQAIFWLGQKKDPRITKFLLDLLNK